MRIVSICSVMILVLVSCSGEKGPIMTVNEELLSEQIEKTIEKNSAGLAGFFTEESFVLSGGGSIVTGKKETRDFYRHIFSGLKLEQIRTGHREKSTGQYGSYFYETGEYIFKEKSFAFMCKWISTDSGWKKEFECISESNGAEDRFAEIESAHERVVNTSAEKDNIKTISELYHDGAFYWTQKQLYRGYEEINSAWYGGTKFTALNSIAHIQVTDDMIYEIGRFRVSGGYSALYILVWVHKDGVWKAVLDSNV